jgi:hypothetical protein
MEETIDIEKPIYKIYKAKAIHLGTFFGGPLVAGYLIAENFKAVGDYSKYKKTWIITILFTIVLFTLILLIPDNSRIPNYIFPIIYSSIAFSLVKSFQGEIIETHQNNGGLFYSWWRIIGVAVIGLITLIVALLAIFYVTESDSSEFSKTYGTMKHEITYDNNNITEYEVDLIASKLIKANFFDETDTKYIYAEKTRNTYAIYISIMPSYNKNPEIIELYSQLQKDIQTGFPNNPFIINLVNESIEKVVKRIE